MYKIKTLPSKIKGTVKISGSKNASLPIIAACLLNEGKTQLFNVPNISDVNKLKQVLVDLGCCNGNNKFSGKLSYKALLIPELKDFRASYYLMGAFLACFKEVEIYAPGGCQIGSRPIDFHIEGFKLAGVKVLRNDHIIHLKADELKPFSYTLPKKSLGATVNLLLLASKICGTTVINNASTEPEVDDLIAFLRRLGLNIVRYAEIVIIKGQKDISKNISYRIMPDRIEALTFIVLGVYSEQLVVKRLNIEHLKTPLKLLEEAGLQIIKKPKKVKVYQSHLKPIKAVSGDYPLLSTDAMPLLYPLFIRVMGKSTFQETIFNNRFKGALELEKTGALLKVDNNCLTIEGKEDLIGNDFVASDLRGAALLLIEAVINGNSTLTNLFYLERGYADIYQKLKRIGVNFVLEEKEFS